MANLFGGKLPERFPPISPPAPARLLRCVGERYTVPTSLLNRLPPVTQFCFVACLILSVHAMASQNRNDNVALPPIGEQRETDMSLEPDVDYKAWKPDRNVKMALAVQTFCVVR